MSEQMLCKVSRDFGIDLGIGSSMDDRRTNPAVYFLWSGQDVVYVGQSIRPLIRAVNHFYDKQFDRSTFLNFREIDLTFAESYMIWFLRPSLNRDIPKLGSFGGNYSYKASRDTVRKICKVLKLLPMDYVLAQFDLANQEIEKCISKMRYHDCPGNYLRLMQRANGVVLESYKEATDGRRMDCH